MKKILSHMMLIAAMAIISASAMAQNSFSYQAVIRNNGEIVSNQDVSLLISILNGSDVCYQEIQKVKTNAYGNISVSVGEGEPKTGSFAAIPWETMQVMMQVEVSTDGTENYVNMGQMQIQPVPYAIYAARTATVIQPAVASEDPIFEVRDNNGELMFAVYETGVKVYVDQDGSKAAKSKFAVAGRSASKGEENILTINGKGTTVYVDGNANKAAKSKFAVAGRSAGKTDTELMTIDNSGSTIYVDGDGKAAKSKFAVAGRSGKGKKSANNYSIDNDNSTLYVDFNDNATGKGNQTDVLTIDGSQATFYIDETEDGKAAKSKFAVAGRSAKSVQTAFVIDGTGTLIYIDDNDNQNSKAAKSTFAVSGRSTGKGNSKFFSITPDSTRIYVNDEVDNTNNGSLAAGFAIVGMTQNTDLLFINKDSTVIKVNTYVAEEVQSATGEVNKLDVVFGIWSGSLKYQFNRIDDNEIIDYCFYDYGKDNYEGFYTDAGDEIHGKYNYIVRVNRNYPDFPIGVGLDKRSDAWTWYSSQDYTSWGTESGNIVDHIGDMKYPLFSLEGVNTKVYLTHLGSWGGSISGADFDIDNVESAGEDTVIINSTTYTVEKHIFKEGKDATKITTYYYYVYKGIVLKIDVKLPTDEENTILRCIEIKEGEAETSFARWLKNSGVTNFSGMANTYLGKDYGEGHYFVDLNLPSGNLWASCNVGAPSSYDLGSYLAWGETEEKATYEQNGYSVAELNNNNDAAWRWGTSDKFPNTSDWCMPTNADWQELIDECVWIWVKDEKGVYITYDESLSERKGEKLVINSINELRWDYSIELINFIYLPAAGFFDYSNINNTGQGYYWSSNKQDYGVNCLVFGESYQQIGNNPGYQGLQVRPVMHKSKTYWVKKPEGTPTGEATGSSSDPFSSINEAVSKITNDFEENGNDTLMTYTIMINGNVAPAEISPADRIKQITLRGANGLSSSNEPQDTIVGTVSKRPLKVNSGNIIIKNLILSGGGINPENPDEPSQIGEGGGLYIDGYAKVVLDSGAFVMHNAACTTGVSYGGGVYNNGQLIMRNNAKIYNNKVGGNDFYGQGGGVYSNGYFKLECGTISENKGVGNYNSCYSKGGGVYNNSYFEITGGLITGNSIEEDEQQQGEIEHGMGGGVYAPYGNSIRIMMTGGEIRDNNSAIAQGIMLQSHEYGTSRLVLAGNPYIDDIYLACVNYSYGEFISINGKLTTNKPMNVTCAYSQSGWLSSLSSSYDPMKYCQFKVLFGDNEQLVRQAIDMFNVAIDGWKINNNGYLVENE